MGKARLQPVHHCAAHHNLATGCLKGETQVLFRIPGGKDRPKRPQESLAQFLL
jgi:hypothetical protein